MGGGEAVQRTAEDPRLDPAWELSVGNAIKASRMRLGLSARQLSALADLSPSYIGKVEAGEIEPSLRAFSRIAKALGMTAHEICFCVLEAAR